jgi:hypothetical protein
VLYAFGVACTRTPAGSLKQLSLLALLLEDLLPIVHQHLVPQKARHWLGAKGARCQEDLVLLSIDGGLSVALQVVNALLSELLRTCFLAGASSVLSLIEIS